MSYIVLSPFSRFTLRNGKRNPKNYERWPEVVSGLRQHGLDVLQVGVASEPSVNGCVSRHDDTSFSFLKELTREALTWLSVDTWFQHFCHAEDLQPGVVLWSRSDPEVFGYAHNINLLADTKYLRPCQFAPWEEVEYDPSCFVEPGVVTQATLTLIARLKT